MSKIVKTAGGSPAEANAAPAGARQPAVARADRPRGRWWRRLLAAALLLAGIGYFHAAILRGLAMPLIVDGTPRGPFDVLIVDGDHRYDAAAAARRECPSRRVLLLEHDANRLVRTGILPPDTEVARKELASRGVPEKAVLVVPGAGRTTWDSGRRLEAWMAQQNDSKGILVLCDRFGGRQTRQIFRRTLSPAHFARLVFCGLPDRRYDERNWWRARCGAKQLVLCWIALIRTYCSGQDEPPPEPWNPDRYEQTLRRATESPTPASRHVSARRLHFTAVRT